MVLDTRHQGGHGGPVGGCGGGHSHITMTIPTSPVKLSYMPPHTEIETRTFRENIAMFQYVFVVRKIMFERLN